MKQKLNIRIIIFFIAAFGLLFIGVATAGIYNAPRTATYMAMGSSFAAFIVLLDIKQDRVLKGFFLIGAGVLYQIVYPKFFYIFVDKSLMPDDVTSHFDIFGQVMSLACAGAGGSIIAVHADKTSSDNEQILIAPIEKTIIEKTVIDNTKHIEQLINSTTALSKKINIIIGVTALFMILTVIYFTTTLI